MKLYINVTQLSRFEALYRNDEKLQCMVERDTGIRWLVDDSEDVGAIEAILVRNKIKHQWNG